MSATELTNCIMLALADIGCLTWRNNCGALPDKRGVWVRYGVGNPGGSDIIGLMPNGRFLAIEVKAGRDTERPDQVAFINAVNMTGGLGFFARDVQYAVDRVRDHLAEPLRFPHHPV